jgi:hypothetical protein
LFRRFFIFVAAIISDVKTAALENQPGTRADFLGDLALAPFFLRAKVLGTNRQRLIGHRLKFFKLMPALRAGIFVSWHSSGHCNTRPWGWGQDLRETWERQRLAGEWPCLRQKGLAGGTPALPGYYPPMQLIEREAG